MQGQAPKGNPMRTTRLLALDLSITATGVVTPWGYNPDGSMSDLQLSTITTKLAGDLRLSEIKGKVYKHVFEFERVDWVIMEDLPPTRAFSTAKLGMVHGAVRTMLIEQGVPYLAVPPSSVKRFATGKGTSPKPDLRMALYKRTGLDVADDNQVDAAWLWLLGHELAGDRVLTMPKPNLSVLAKLVMPAISPRDGKVLTDVG